MLLTRYTLKHIEEQKKRTIPPENIFDLPEKVLQFGTSALLRGSPGYFIDKANRQGLFNGRIVVIKSTEAGDASAFDKQDCLYTVCIRGIENGKKVEEDIINSSVSRVISAKSDWGSILQCAHNHEMKVIISNTTEVGFTFVNNDIRHSPPVSFPGQLLSFLYERFKAFNGNDDSGMVIIPTEIIPDNGIKLESIVLELAHLNDLEGSFMDWLENSNYFCNSLVDRIVPGAPSSTDKPVIEQQLGYKDDLIIIAEPYRLWAIETPSEKVKNVLSFSIADNGVAIAADITRFRELKLRLLNGTHTLSCGLSVLAGFNTVKEAMINEDIKTYMYNLMTDNIIPAITGHDISQEVAHQFAVNVVDRFTNPYIEHKWLSISVQYSSKMKMRNLPVLLSYYKRYNSVPEHIALGFAAYLLFMKCEQTITGFIGQANGMQYTIQDDKAPFFCELWNKFPVNELVEKVLQEEALWGTDLTELAGFQKAVTEKLRLFIEDGVKQTVRNTLTDKTVEHT